MRTLIIYTSSTGFTKRYAEWIAEEISDEVITFKEAKKKGNEFFEGYDSIVYGGWCMGGKVINEDWFKENMLAWKNKKLAIFCVGASPMDSPEVPEALDNNLSEEEKKIAKIFYCQGGLNYEKMKLPMKIMMKMYASSIAKKKDATEFEKTKAEMITKSYDISDKKYINPIIEYLKA